VKKVDKLELIDYKSKNIKNDYYTHEKKPTSLIIVFPGYGYDSNSPLFFYLKELVYDLGYDFITIDYRYNENQEFLDLPESDKLKWLEYDSNIFYETIKQNTDYKQYFLLGKSLGTTAILNILQNEKNREKETLILLTPAMSQAALIDIIKDFKTPVFFQIGDVDPYYSKKNIKFLKNNKNIELDILSDMGHAYETGDDIYKSILNLITALKNIEKFLENVKNDQHGDESDKM